MENKQKKLIFENKAENPEWDQYVSNHPDGHYTQLSSWARIKQIEGWFAERVIMSDQQQNIIGGCQYLIKKYIGCLWLVCISKGPIVDNNESTNFSYLVDEIINRLGRKLFLLYIQPADTYHSHCQLLLNKGFTLSDEGDIEKPATVLIDLEGTEEQVLSRIKSKKRRNIRQALKNGIICHPGSFDDLQTFFKLHQHTSEVHNFGIQSYQFFIDLWENFYPSNNLVMIIAEYEQKPVTIMLGIIFKNKFYSYRIGWSGEHANLHPNECIYGYAIEWARKSGLKWFDFGGIELEAARAVLENREYIDEERHSYTTFKLRFSESVAVYPQTYRYISKTLGFYALTNFFLKIQLLNTLIRKIYQLIRKR